MIKNTLLALLFMTSIFLTGSDGVFFPIPNFIGLGLMGVFTWIATRPEKARANRRI